MILTTFNDNVEVITNHAFVIVHTNKQKTKRRRKTRTRIFEPMLEFDQSLIQTNP